jgi:ketosteroid isomerase-like protein
VLQDFGAAMSEKAVETVRRMFDAASRIKDPSGRQVDATDPATLGVVLGFFDAGIEFHEDPAFPEAGVYRGTEAVNRYFTQFLESFDEFSFEVEDFIDAGEDKALAPILLRSRGKGSGASVETRPAWIYTTRDGKVTRIDAFLDRAEALAAAGVS